MSLLSLCNYEETVSFVVHGIGELYISFRNYQSQICIQFPFTRKQIMSNDRIDHAFAADYWSQLQNTVVNYVWVLVVLLLLSY